MFSQVVRHRLVQFFLAGFYILRTSVVNIGYQEDILKKFEISKMAAKMAGGAIRKIAFEPVD